MQLPKAVQQQLEDADRMVAQINEAQTEIVEAPKNTEPLDAPAEPKQVNPEPVPPQVEEPWEQRYRTLRGMYDADVPRLHAQTKELNTQVQVLADELEAVKADRIEQRQKASITDEDREAFGPDLINLIERATEVKVETLRAREAQLVSKIDELTSQLGNVSERQVVSDKESFLSRLTAKAPAWQTLNTDQGFINWLQEVDAVYGIPRQMALNSAYEAFDDSRVAAIFNTYSGNAAPKSTQAPAGNNPELQRQVAPSRSRSSAPPTDTSNSKIYSENEIAEFYSEWRRGMFNNDDAVRIENDIHAAIAEGRIRR